MEMVQAALIAMEMMIQHANIIGGKKATDRYLTKICIETEISASFTLWQTTMEIIKAEQRPCLVSIKSSHIPLKKQIKQSKMFTFLLNVVRDLC